MRRLSYNNAVRFLNSLIGDPEKKRRGNLRLERISLLLNLIGNPEKAFKSIHVGGTSGKGSTSFIIASILKASGLKIGLHISPHLSSINERIQINLKPISNPDFAELVSWIAPYVLKVERIGSYGKPSYFETLVALSFEYFKRHKIDLAVVEVGLGGSLDATNVISPDVAVLTNVNLDHTEILGDTVELIAKDKSGIVKPGLEVITAAKQTSVLKILKNRCRQKNARLTIIGKDIEYFITRDDLKGLHLNIPKFGLVCLTSRLLGAHQAENITLAVAAVKKLSFEISNKAIKLGVKRAFIPGRLEIFRAKSGLIILDGAHNPAKISALASAITRFFPRGKISVIFAVKKNKDILGMLSSLKNIADTLYLTKFHKITDFGHYESADPAYLNQLLKNNAPVSKHIIVNDPEIALKTALKTNSSLPILITGSLYLVGELRPYIIKKYEPY